MIENKITIGNLKSSDIFLEIKICTQAQDSAHAQEKLGERPHSLLAELEALHMKEVKSKSLINCLKFEGVPSYKDPLSKGRKTDRQNI